MVNINLCLSVVWRLCTWFKGITESDIQADIDKYDRRITRLKCQLMDIPGGSKRERWKFNKKRDKIQQDILHVQGLKQLAQDALDGKYENALGGACRDE